MGSKHGLGLTVAVLALAAAGGAERGLGSSGGAPLSVVAAPRAGPRRFATRTAALVRNTGWTDPEAVWFARCRGYAAWLVDDGAVFRAASSASATATAPSSPATDDATTVAVMRLRFVGARPGAWTAGAPRAERASFFLGNDASAWRGGETTYAGATRASLYDGVDLLWRGVDGQLAFDLRLAPGADASRIALRLDGAAPRIAAGGALVAETALGEFRLSAPVAWQDVEGSRRPVAARFVLREGGDVGLALGAHDAARAVTVDPTLSFSSYIGTDDRDGIVRVVARPDGGVFAAGYTKSAAFPTTLGAFDRTHAADSNLYDAVVLAFSDAGELLWSTFAGGSSNDYAWGLAVDSAGAPLVSGVTLSPSFPTLNAFQPTFRGGSGDAVVFKLAPHGGSLLFSTFYGGAGIDTAVSVGIDPAGPVWIAGSTSSSDLPLASPRQAQLGNGAGMTDAFVARFSPDCATLQFATYHGGAGAEDVGGPKSGASSYDAMAVDRAGACHVVGSTTSSNFPTLGAYQTTRSGGFTDAFVFQYAATGALVHSTYLGGSQDEGAHAVAVDADGAAYVVGETSSADFPTKSPLQAFGGATDAFVAKFGAGGGAPRWSTFLGGAGDDHGYAATIGPDGSLYGGGGTFGGIPLLRSLQPTVGGTRDGFVFRMSPAGSLRYSTLVGGTGLDHVYDIAVDAAGAAVLVGATQSSDLPILSAWQGSHAGGIDEGFVMKLAPGPPKAPTRLSGTARHWYPNTLSWTDESDDETGFVMERRREGESWVVLTTTGPDVQTLTDSQMLVGAVYDYRVCAVNIEGTSAFSNVVTLRAPSDVVPPPPIAPCGLVAQANSSTEASLSWIDSSFGESGFEVQRRTGGGEWTSVGSIPEDITSSAQAGLPVGWRGAWRVRAMSTLAGPSSFCDVAFVELPGTMPLTLKKASLTDSRKRGKDAAKVMGTYAFTSDSPDGAWDPVAEGLSLHVGTSATALEVTIPPHDVGWKAKKRTLTWRSRKGAKPKVVVTLDTKRRRFTIAFSAAQWPRAMSADGLLLMSSGDDGGAATATLRRRKSGALWLFP